MIRKLSFSIGMAGLAIALFTGGVEAQTAEVESLRGPVAVDETSSVHEIKKQNTEPRRFERAYRQQPPMIPHEVDKYQVDLKVNQCMRCHDWPFNIEENATKISETHYFDRDGVALDRVAGTRWFCTQCHVPQAKTPELVRNDFKSAIDVK